jgi:ribokinase
LTDVIVVGDALLDVAVEAGALAEGGDVRGHVRVQPGGTGANAAVWAADSVARTRLHTRVGDDTAGRLIADALSERGVECAFAVDSKTPTGAMLIVQEEGERSMVADRGASGHLSPDDLPDTLDARAVLVSGYLLFDPESEDAGIAALARASAEHVAVDAASWPLLSEYGVERFFERTANATLLFANEREAEVLVGETGLQAAMRLAERYAVACVKLGSRGAVVAGGKSAVLETGVEGSEVVDATGAGDAFGGTFLAALARGESLRAALRLACKAGARAAASKGPWP